MILLRSLFPNDGKQTLAVRAALLELNSVRWLAETSQNVLWLIWKFDMLAFLFNATVSIAIMQFARGSSAWEDGGKSANGAGSH